MEMADRAGALKDQACRQAMEHAIEIGRGGVFLKVSAEQYATLRRWVDGLNACL